MARKTGAITANNSSIVLDNPDGNQFVLITISGTYGGVQAGFSASDDGGTTYYTLGLIKLSDLATVQSATGAIADNSSNAWVGNIAPFTQVRVLATAWTSGSASVKITSLISVGASR